jgi:hypothetical protein
LYQEIQLSSPVIRYFCCFDPKSFTICNMSCERVTLSAICSSESLCGIQQVV